jgi:hypothetical protein
MTDKEWKAGILVCTFVFKEGQAFVQESNSSEIQQGLANLVARHELEII